MNLSTKLDPSSIIQGAITDVRTTITHDWSKDDSDRLHSHLVSQLEAGFNFAEGGAPIPDEANQIISNVVETDRRHSNGRLTAEVMRTLVNYIRLRLSHHFTLTPKG